jgi:hypothetical protein
MPDLVELLSFERSQGVRLSLEEYQDDFRQRELEIRNHDSWKFERRQDFQELYSMSWRAMRRGDWDGALKLMEDRQGELRKTVLEDLKERGTTFHRVRVVEEPLTPYVQWELHSLRVRAQCGEPCRVVGTETIRDLESADPLPEVVVLGGRTFYEVVYNEDGFLDGGVRFTSPDLIEAWESFVKELYDSGQDVISYVDEYVAKLPPPPPV